MTENVYLVGNRVTVRTSTPFQDADGTAFDPPVVRFKVTDPAGATTTYTYPTDDEISKNDTGDYSCTFDVDSSGQCVCRIEGETLTGENRGAAEVVIIIKASQI